MKMAAKKKTEWWRKYSYSQSGFIVRAMLFVVLVFLFLNYRGIIISASVNGQSITRFDVIKELEKQSGKTTLDSLINKALIEQKAKEAHVSISDSDIDAEINKIEASVKDQNQNMDDLLAAQGLTRDDLRDQVKTQLQVEKLLEGDITVTDDEITKYITDNKDYLPTGKTDDELKSLATDQLKQQKLSQRFSTWLDEIRKSSSIQYYTNY